ncbi:MAG TPA: glycosyl hydrolase, partial [Acidobacteria bacterium]|nr:glycosyl hydrolase [Acidobacteriota bacterium]
MSAFASSRSNPFHSVLRVILLVVGVAFIASAPLHAQAVAPDEDGSVSVDPELFETLEYRQLDFTRGGRSTAVTGVVGSPLVYYHGSTGGGVWKTVNAGQSWDPISDETFEAGSIGAIAVAESDLNVVYVGTGSACPRGNISPGVGMYRSTDAGKTWRHAGLPDAGQIGKIRVHPKNHDLVYVAVLGNLFGPSDTRGVFRSKDGGETWEHVLAVSDRTGAVDLSMDPSNPRVLYAGMWAVRRSPWSIDSGSMDGGIYKTTDGGDTWARLEGGLPTGVMVGKTSVSVSPADPDRVWALIEAADDEGGVYRSDDAGETWQRVNRERRLLQRAWYYIHIYADPVDVDTVYALNTGFYKSTDGGRTYERIAVPHGDNHDLWLNPEDPSVMINANDGGANVSFTGGRAWSTQQNQPTAEIYRITVDDQFPYRVYGAQQDNSTASVLSRGPGDFYSVGGGESGHIAVDPRDPDIVFAGSYGGTITRINVRTRIRESIRAYPDSQTGQRAADMQYRFQWNAPIRISPHDPDVLYHTSQVVHRTRDGGHSC